MSAHHHIRLPNFVSRHISRARCLRKTSWQKPHSSPRRCRRIRQVELAW